MKNSFIDVFIYFFQRLLHLRRMVHGARNEVQLLQHKTLDVVYVTFSWAACYGRTELSWLQDL